MFERFLLWVVRMAFYAIAFVLALLTISFLFNGDLGKEKFIFAGITFIVALMLFLGSFRSAPKRQAIMTVKVEAVHNQPVSREVSFEPMFRIEYADRDGVITERDICPIEYELLSNGSARVKAWCFLQNDTRTFRTERMMNIINLRTKRQISNLANYLEREMPQIAVW